MRHCVAGREDRVVVSRADGSGLQAYELRPNYSLSRPTALLWFGLISSVTLGVALVFAAIGLWPVLPFAGLEVVVLAYAFVVCAKRGSMRELVEIAESKVYVSAGCERLRKIAEFPRGWARVDLENAEYAWYPSRLLLRAHGREIEIGAFLVEGERAQLAKDLNRSVAWA